MIIITVGIDLAKNVFAVHGVDEYGKAVCRRTAARNHQCAACVDVKRVGPAPGEPD